MGIIFFLTGEYPPQPGGVSDHTAALACELANRIIAPIILCGDNTGMSNDNGFPVYRVGRSFAPFDVRHLARALEAFPAPRVIFIQYAPHALGLRGMNIPLTLWLAWRAWFHGDRLVAYFHEVAFPFKGPLRHRILSIAQNLMAGIVAASATVVLATTEAWLPRLASVGLRRGAGQVLPVFSNLPEVVVPRAVETRRMRWLQETGAERLVGHFGTFGNGVAALICQTLAAFPHDSSTAFLLMGRRAENWLTNHAREPWASRCRVVDETNADALAETLAACDVALQPYPDGVTTRRTTAMSALSLGVPLVSNDGLLTDLCWRTHQPCARLADKPDGAALAASLGEVLRLSIEERMAAGANGRQWYTVHASRANAAMVVKQLLAECQHS